LPEELYRARRGPRDAAAEAVLAHAVACAVCSEELLRQEAFDRPRPLPAARLAQAWERFERGEPAPGPHAPRRRFGVPGPALALAATLAAVAVGLGVWLAGRPATNGSALSEPPPEDSLRGGGPVAGGHAPAGKLGAPPEEFVFPAADPAPKRVLVFDAAGSYRWTSEPATGGRVSFPEAERRKLRPGVDYFWSVIDDPAAPTIAFRVEPR
jgi:hypothetical protein